MIDFSNTGITVPSSVHSGASNTSSKSSEKAQLDTENSNKKENRALLTKKVKPASQKELSQSELLKVAKLKKRDLEVKAHEQAHISSGGIYVRGGAHYEYEKGPDGKNYVVGGEVQIDTLKIPGDPEATAKKMQAIRRAALSPASPSPQDRRVAAKATHVENKMRQEIIQNRYEENDVFKTGKSETQPSHSNLEGYENKPLFPGGIINITG